MAMDYLDEATVEVAQAPAGQDEAGPGRVVALAGTAVLKNQQRNLQALQDFAGHDNRLLNAGAELLALCVAVSRMPQPEDMHRFRQGMIESIGVLKQKVAALDYPRSVADKTCFLFCIVLDELILHSEWGERSGWEHRTLLSELFGVGDGGEQFYQVADKALSQPNLLVDLLELIYLFLKIGFRGQYRLAGRERLDTLYHQIESVVLGIRPRVPFTAATSVELPRVRKPGRQAHFGRQAVLFLAGVAISWGAASYWYQHSFEHRARDFLGLTEFSQRYLEPTDEKEVVYVSTPEEMDSSARLESGARSVTGAWLVQVASFRRQSQAERFIADHELQSMGAEVRTVNNLYRVVIPADDRERAQSLVKEARNWGVKDAFIISNQ